MTVPRKWWVLTIVPLLAMAGLIAFVNVAMRDSMTLSETAIDTCGPLGVSASVTDSMIRRASRSKAKMTDLTEGLRSTIREEPAVADADIGVCIEAILAAAGKSKA